MDSRYVDTDSPPHPAATTKPCVVSAPQKLAPMLETQRVLMKEYGRDKDIPKVDAAPSEVRQRSCVWYPSSMFHLEGLKETSLPLSKRVL